MGTECNDGCVYKMEIWTDRQRHTQREIGQMMAEAETEVMQQEFPELPAAARGRALNRLSLKPSIAARPCQYPEFRLLGF